MIIGAVEQRSLQGRLTGLDSDLRKDYPQKPLKYLFFLSENANSVTGQFLGINGGCSV